MSASAELPARQWLGRVIDARLQLLDRQIHDERGTPMGTVDDVELDGLALSEDIPHVTGPVVAALVSSHVLATGSSAAAARRPGRSSSTGNWSAGSARPSRCGGAATGSTRCGWSDGCAPR